MKKACSFICITVLFAAFVFLGSAAASTSSKPTAVGFYRSDFTKGIADEGPKHLSVHGYSYNIYSDASFSKFKSALENDDVIFIHSHGAEGLFTLSPSVRIYGNQIASASISSEAKLVYLSACKTGLSSSTYGNVGSALVNKGVDSVVAFTKDVTAKTDTNGIHRFNSIVVYKLVSGYSVSSALLAAKAQIYKESEEYWGADSYIIYGSGSTTIN